MTDLPQRIAGALMRIRLKFHGACFTLPVVAFLILFVPFISFSATLYVSVNGSDSSDGSQARPFRNLQTAVNVSNPGDTVVVLPGIYEEKVATGRSGIEGKPIKYLASGPGVIIRGFTVSHDYTIVDGFEITGVTSAYTYHLKISGNHCQILNNYIHDGGENVRGLGVLGNQNYVSGNTVDTLTYTGILVKGSGNFIVDNIFRNIASDVFLIFGHDHIIRKNIITGTRVSSLHSDIFQTFGNNGDISYNILIEQNLIKDNEAQLCQVEQAGVKDIRDWTFRNNLVVNLAFACNVYAPGFKFFNNTFFHVTQNTGHVIFLGNGTRGVAENARIKNNFFINCGSRPLNYGYYYVPAGLTDFEGDYNYVTGPPESGYPPKSGFSETNGINGGDPKFLNISSGDFSLSKESAALISGTNLSQYFVNDFNNSIRPKTGAWSIGAFADKNDTLSVTKPLNLIIIE